MKKVRTAVIPVAGLGTRLLPATKAIPKEMVPVLDQPVIQYAVEEAIAAGLTRIVMVTRSGKESIENHFDRHFELETVLERKGKDKLLQAVRDIVPEHVEFVAIRQPQAAGLGDAIRCAAPAVHEEPFAVLLPDVLVNTQADAQWNMRTMIDAYRRTGATQILVERVSPYLVDQYGIVDCHRKPLQAGESARIYGMVEKPAFGEAPSYLSIVGRYVLPAEILELLKKTGKGAGGEIQLTDALFTLLEHSQMQALMMRGRTFDCGNRTGYAQANLAMAMQDKKIAAEMLPLLLELLGAHAEADAHMPIRRVA
jgi:UTP--glucose-1-phosphate uridylyltransferase